MNNYLDIELINVEDLDVEFEIGTIIHEGGGGIPYEGPYEVTPKAYDIQTLLTKNKSMRDNVTVDKVPYQAVSNEYGGLTINIAYEE